MHATTMSKLGLIFLLVTGLLTACGGPSGPQIKVEDVWARPALAMEEMQPAEPSGGAMGTEQGMAGTGAVFMIVTNEGDEPDRLLGGQTEVAKVVEIHETRMEGEVMKMQMLPDGLEIAAKGEVLLKPGGYHVMLIGLQRDLKPGDSFGLTLQFEKSGTLTVEPEVRELY